jgi:ABC-type spermidine/putrescine transport system permease subunit II
MAGRLNPILTFVFAALILVFSGGPVLLSLYGSLVPDRLLLSDDASIFTEGPNFETYRYVFTGQLPDSYQQASANRAMISDAARQVPQALLNSAINALAVMALNLILGAPAAFIFARYVFPGKKLSFMYLILSPLVPAVALVTPIYMMMQFLGLVGSPLGIILVHTAKALPFTVLILSVFFRKIPRRDLRGRGARSLQPFPDLLARRRAAVAAFDRRDGALRLHAQLLRVHVRHAALGRLADPSGLRGDGGARAQYRRQLESPQHRHLHRDRADAGPRHPRLALRRRRPPQRRREGIESQ